jgi:hypothetical protein
MALKEQEFYLEVRKNQRKRNMFKIIPINGSITAVDGFYASVVKSGFKKDDYDLGYIYSENLCDVAYTLEYELIIKKRAMKEKMKEASLRVREANMEINDTFETTLEDGLKDV